MKLKKTIWIFVLMITFLSSFAFADSMVTDQEVYFKFDGNANDATPNGYDASVVGATQVPGIINQQYDYDGNDYLTFDASTIASSNEGTIDMWFNIDSFASVQRLFSYGGDNNKIMSLDIREVTGSYYLVITNTETGNNIMRSTTALSTGVDYYVTLTSDGFNWNLYLNDVSQTLTSIVGVNTGQWFGDITQSNHHFYIGALEYNGALESWIDGTIDELGVWSSSISGTNRTYRYNGGSPGEPQQYPYTDLSPTTVNDSTESTAIVRQTGSVSFVNPTTIISSNFEVPANNTPLYGDYTFRISANNVNDVYCEAIIDGNVVANKTRTQSPGDVGNMFIQFPTLTLRNDTGLHTQSLVCERTSGVGLITISETVGIGHFLVDEDGNIIPDNTSIFNTDISSGTLFSPIESFNVTVGNKTTSDKYHSIVVEGMVEFTNNDASPELLAVYGDINGTNCSTNIRDVGAGSSGSVSFDCILENATANQTYQINLYGNGSNANYKGNMVAKDLFLSDEEILGGTGILKGTNFSGNTPTRLFNGTGGNLNHDVTNVFQKVGYSIVTDLDTTVDMYVKIINGDTYQTVNFTREFTAGEVGYLIGQDVLEGVVQDPNYELELWANCGTVGATCSIVGGASLGYITDVTTTILNLFNVTAYNAWNGSQILTFNATDGATFSTTNGLIEYVTEEQFENITISSIGYVNQTFLSHNTSQNINASLYESRIEITVDTLVTETPITSFSVVTNQGTFATTNGTVILYPNIANYTWNITAAGYKDLINQQVNVTNTTASYNFNMGDAYLEVWAKVFIFDTNLASFDINVSYNDTTVYYETGYTANDSILVESGLVYNIAITSNNIFPAEVDLLVNSDPENYMFTVYTLRDIRFNFFDENTLEPLTNVTFDILSDAYSDTVNTGVNSTYTFLSIPNADYEIRYNLFNDTYRDRSYYVRVPLVSSNFSNISLFSVREDISTLFQRFIVSQGAIPLEGTLLEIQRPYVDNATNGPVMYETVEIALVDSQGQAVFSAIPNTQAYRFRILFNYSLLQTFEPAFLVDTSSEIIVDTSRGVTENFNTAYGVSSSLVYDEDTDYFVFDYTNGGGNEICLIVTYALGSQRTTDETCSNSNAATLTLFADSNVTGIYYATGTIDIDDARKIINDASKTPDNAQKEALQIFAAIAGALFFLFAATISGFINPVYPILVGVMGLIAFGLSFLGLVSFEITLVGSVVVCGLVILFMVVKK